MGDTDKRRVLQLSRVTGNGTLVTEPIILVLRDPATGEILAAADGTPEVFMRLRPMDEETRSAIVAKHTHLERDPNAPRGALVEFTDVKAANDEIFDATILSWEGIAGADGRPLVCTRQTKLLLDVGIRGQVMRKAFGSEVAEVLAASFR